MPENLVAFRTLIRTLLAEGVKPTATAVYHRAGGKYTDHGPGTGCTFNSGKYTQARAEELLRAGWRKQPNGGFGVWVKD